MAPARSCPTTASALLLFATACVELPEPPPMQDLSALMASYEEPSGQLPRELVPRVLTAVTPYLDIARLFDDLSVVHTSITEASQALDEATTYGNARIQGGVRARFTCPGYEPEPSDDPAIDGEMELTLALADSHIKRAFEGAAANCRLVAFAENERHEVQFSAALAADLGADIAIGDASTSTLTAHFTDLVLHSELNGKPLDVRLASYDVRLTDEALEVLVDPTTLGLDRLGTLVGVLHRDGRTTVREQRGEWRCTNSQRCILDRGGSSSSDEEDQ